METAVKPKITVSFAVDVDLEYDSFRAGTAQEFAIRIEDDLIDALMEMRPEVVEVHSSITAIDEAA